MLSTKRCFSPQKVSKHDWENSEEMFALGGTRMNSLQFRRIEKKITEERCQMADKVTISWKHM